MKIVKLFPRENGKYHFGEHTLESTSLIFSSDSLFSAIVNNYRKLYPEDVEGDVENLRNLRLSSVFPAYGSILFIPKPMTKLGFRKDQEKEIRERSKDIKKIDFISLKALDEHNKEKLDIDNIIDKQFLITRDERDLFKENKQQNLFVEITEEKIAIDRTKGITSKGDLFIVSYIKPRNGTYFYFLIGDDKIESSIKKKLYVSIRLIADEGLGGERSSGAGLFDEIRIEDDAIFGNYTFDSDHRMSLSLVFPKDEREFRSSESYQLIERGGYICFMKGTGLRKKGILMMKEGSIFKGDVDGKVVDVSPNNEYDVYRFGRFFGIPIRYVEDDAQ